MPGVSLDKAAKPAGTAGERDISGSATKRNV